MDLEKTATRLWKRLSPEERLEAAAAYWKAPAQETLGAAVGALVKARKLRPQVARSLPEDAKVRILATVHDPGEDLAGSLLVALHLEARRPLLAAFLDAAGLAHEQGILADDGEPQPLEQDAARRGVAALRQAGFPPAQVATYLNALWLQDPDRWSVVERIAPEL